MNSLLGFACRVVDCHSDFQIGVHRIPVDHFEKGVDVAAAHRAEVHEVGMLIHIQAEQRRGVPDRKGVLRVADIVEQAAVRMVVRQPDPAARRDAGRLQVGLPVSKEPNADLIMSPIMPSVRRPCRRYC